MIEALLFDLDGTLAQSDPIHFRAHKAVLAEHDVLIDEDFYHQTMSGLTNEALTALLLPHLDSDERNTCSMRKETIFREQAALSLDPVAGAHSIVKWGQDRGLRLALVTSAPAANARLMLDALDLAESFDTIVLAEDLSCGKPDPLPYRTAMAKFQTKPTSCIAFEDSASGVRSASGSGAFTIGIATGAPASALIDAGADIAVADFEAPALWETLASKMLPELTA